MTRPIATLVLAAAALAAAAPAPAANKDIERLAVQIATLQGQLAEVQRAAEESRSELRRLTELIAEQNALLKKSVADHRQQDEATSASFKDLNDRVAELAEALDVLVRRGGGRGRGEGGRSQDEGGDGAGHVLLRVVRFGRRKTII